VYFTDAPGIYYIPPGGKVIRVADGFKNPNGIQLSPDEKVLYANNEFGEYLLAFDVQPDGTLRNRRDFAKYRSVKPTPTAIMGQTASQSMPRAVFTSELLWESKSSTTKVNTWAPFRSQGLLRTSLLRVPTKKLSMWSAWRRIQGPDAGARF
jgi:SMP-30/Gluconolactonase/LRE-like region